MNRAHVGDIVNFYNKGLLDADRRDDVALNGQGAGPYPALVIQTFDGPYANLKVFAWGGEWTEGSVSPRGEGSLDRFWAPTEEVVTL